MRRVLILALMVTAGLAPRASAALSADSPSARPCRRGCLKGVLNSLFSAMLKHDTSSLPLSPSLKATLNGQPAKLGEGIWKTAQAIPFRLDAIDPEEGQAAAEAVIRDSTGLALFLVRLKVEEGRIGEIEMMLPEKNSPLYAPEKLTSVPPMYLKKVPDAERATRFQLLAAADAYFTALQTEGTSQYKPAPLAPGANRFENGLQTTNVPLAMFHKSAATAQQQMDEAWFKGWIVKDRRYPVLDEPHGIVLAIVLMQVSASQAVLLSEIFKVSDWKIQQVQAVLVGVPHDGPTGWN